MIAFAVCLLSAFSLQSSVHCRECLREAAPRASGGCLIWGGGGRRAGSCRNAAYLANVCVADVARERRVGTALLTAARGLCHKWGPAPSPSPSPLHECCASLVLQWMACVIGFTPFVIDWTRSNSTGSGGVGLLMYVGKGQRQRIWYAILEGCASRMTCGQWRDVPSSCTWLLRRYRLLDSRRPRESRGLVPVLLIADFGRLDLERTRF